MQDLITGFQAAPLWAQVAMVLAAVTALWMMTAKSLTKRRHAAIWITSPCELGQGPSTSRDWPDIVPVTVGDRAFQIRYDVRMSARQSSYRGPTGQLLITATQLGGTRWAMHQVDIQPVAKWLSRLIGNRLATGDPAFDARFIIKQDGLPAREGWLDAATREALGHFFERVPKRGVVWIREGDLQFIMSQPWTDLDGLGVRRLMEQQSLLADALERTTGYVR